MFLTTSRIVVAVSVLLSANHFFDISPSYSDEFFQQSRSGSMAVSSVLQATERMPEASNLATNSFASNEDIAIEAESHIGEIGGQCKVFVQNVANAVGITLGPGYRQAYLNAGIEVMVNEASRGDIIQLTNPTDPENGTDYTLHTAIIIAVLEGGNFKIVDSNWGFDEVVTRRTYNPISDASSRGLEARFYRLGQVPSPSPPLPTEMRTDVKYFRIYWPGLFVFRTCHAGRLQAHLDDEPIFYTSTVDGPDPSRSVTKFLLPKFSWTKPYIRPYEIKVHYWDYEDGHIPDVTRDSYFLGGSFVCAGGHTEPFPTPTYNNELPLYPSEGQASFVADITIPDGTVVSPGQALLKTWRMKNTDSAITWHGGYQLAFVGGEQMGAPAAVDVPNTPPGQTVDINVNLLAPSDGGLHTGYWQLRNPQGTYFGPKIWIQINVQTASSYITTLSADPPSPSNSSSVRIHARVENFPNFRAMRLKIDGGVAYELGAPEFYYDWNTSGYAAGDHNIVIEVADQTDTSWSHPETRGMTYTLEGTTGSNNHAPNRPILVANPAYDWYVTIGSPPQLCAQEQGDPDGDAITQYRFVGSASVGTADSGWVGGPCHTFGSLTPGTYEWHAQVKDSQGGTSDWSDNWHFTVEPTGVTAYIDHFSPASPSNAEEVKIYGCSTGHAGVNVTLRVLVNDANDGTDSGEWHIIKEQGSPCFNDVDVPIWRTLEYADGPHLVRVVAMAIQPDAGDVYDEVYTLNHRRPDSTRLVAPVPLSRDIREAIYLNSRTITFQWEPTIRAQSYTLHIGTNPSPEGDTNPVFRQTFASSVTEYIITFGQDYPTLYWQVEATNDVGSNTSGDQLFGIDRVEPSCTVQSLSGTTYESVFQVSWNGSDNLAGVRTFDIQYMDSDRGTWEDWLTGIPSTKTYELFTGQPGHTYYYRCRAMDNANNTGAHPSSADTSTKIDPAARPPTPWWDSAYNGKRNLIIQNNMPGVILPAGYPVHLHFDSNTTPTAATLYSASLSSAKCNDLRIVYNDVTELDRVVQNCSSSAIDIWFRTQLDIPGGSSDNMAHQLYYGNASAAAPPADPNQVWYPYLEVDTIYLYFFQEGSGSIAHDSSGNGRDCSLDPSVQWTPSKFGNGLRFNRSNLGDSRSLNCGSAIPRSSFTLDFWYKPDPDDGGYITAELAGGGNGGGGNNWLLQNFEGRLRLDVWPCPTCGSSEVRSNFNLRDSQYVNKWNHLAVTFNGVNEVKFYINGNLESTKHLNQSGINTYTPPLEIGSAEGIGQIKANIGAFRISDGVKTSFPYGAFAAITNEPATAAGAPIAPPITGSPDLAVLSLTAYPYPDGGVIVQVVVENQGDLSTQNGFYTDLYLDHVPTGEGDFTGSIRFWVNDPIAAGATATLTTVITNLSALGGAGSQSAAPASETSGTLYAQADSVGAVTELDKINNIYSAGTEICVATTDAYESDDGVESASVISVGQTQTHNFDRPGDQDWVKFEAQADESYVFHTFNLGLTSDTYLYLYDTDGATLLTSNDDYGGSLASQIEWTAPATGTYYLLAQHWNPNVGGCGTTYDVEVTLDLTNEVFLPLILK
jgi:hypothetical protein